MSNQIDGRPGRRSAAADFVYIVESPSADDLLNARTEGRLLTEALRLAGVLSFYHTAVNYSSFLAALGARLWDAVALARGLPILHISAHGTQHGLGLTDGRFLEWRQLRDLLLPINSALNGGLVVCISSCSGFSGCRMAMSEEDRLPFFGLVGHTGVPRWSDAAVAFVTFYHRLFKGSTVLEAVEVMRSASGDARFLAMRGTEARDTWLQHIETQRRAELREQLRRILAPPAGGQT